MEMEFITGKVELDFCYNSRRSTGHGIRLYDVKENFNGLFPHNLIQITSCGHDPRPSIFTNSSNL